LPTVFYTIITFGRSKFDNFFSRNIVFGDVTHNKTFLTSHLFKNVKTQLNLEVSKYLNFVRFHVLVVQIQFFKNGSALNFETLRGLHSILIIVNTSEGKIASWVNVGIF